VLRSVLTLNEGRTGARACAYSKQATCWAAREQYWQVKYDGWTCLSLTNMSESIYMYTWAVLPKIMAVTEELNFFFQ